MMLVFIAFGCSKQDNITPDFGEITGKTIADNKSNPLVEQLPGVWMNENFEINFGPDYFSLSDSLGMADGNYLIELDKLVLFNVNNYGVGIDLFSSELQIYSNGNLLIINDKIILKKQDYGIY